MIRSGPTSCREHQLLSREEPKIKWPCCALRVPQITDQCWVAAWVLADGKGWGQLLLVTRKQRERPLFEPATVRDYCTCSEFPVFFFFFWSVHMAAVAALGAAGQYLQLDFSPFFFKKKILVTVASTQGLQSALLVVWCRALDLVPGAGFFLFFFIFV